MNHKNAITPWSRICPKCGGTIYHITKTLRDRSENQGRTCGGKASLNCKVISAKQRKVLSERNMGMKQRWAGKPRRSSLSKSRWSRFCPNCQRPMYYCDEDHLRDGIRKNSVCKKCHNYIYHNTWKDVIDEHSIKKMRATKAGFSSWKEYTEKMPQWKQYKADVWRLTYANLRHNPPLENFHLRGKCGVVGAYQIDHIVSVRHGFDHGLQPHVIAEYKNLRMIPWKENLLKG